MAFFASPAKPWLVKRLNARKKSAMVQKQQKQEFEKQAFDPHDSKSEQPLMGLPSDPGQELDNAVKEIREEVEAMRKRGLSVSMPTGQDMRISVENKLDRKL